MNTSIIQERKKVTSTLEDFRVSVLWHYLKSSLPWMLLIFLATVFMSFFYLRHVNDVYSSNATLMRKVTKQTEILGIGDLLKEDQTEIDMEIQLLKSKVVLSKALDSLPLKVEYSLIGKISNTQFYDIIPFEFEYYYIDPSIVEKPLIIEFIDDQTFSLDIGGESKNIQSYKVNKSYDKDLIKFKLIKTKDLKTNQKYQVLVKDYSTVIDQISKQLIVTPINNSKTLNISYESIFPKKSYDIVNKLSSYYLEFDRQKKSESINNTIEFLSEQIDVFNKGYFEIQDSLKKYRLEIGYVDPSIQIQQRISQMNDLEKNKIYNELEASTLLWLNEYLKSDNDLQNLSGVTNNEISIGFQTVINLIIAKQNERNRMLLNVTPDHPSVILLNKEINNLKLNLQSQIKLAIDKNKLNKENIEGKIQSNYLDLFTLPDKETEFAKIKQENDLKYKFLMDLVEKKNMYLISRAGIVSDYIILHSPKIPSKPIAPNKDLIKLLGVLGGLFFGLLLVAIRYILHTKITSLEEVRENSNANILGVVPKHKAFLERSAVVVTENPKSSISEAFRGVRSNLEFINSSNQPKLVVTTSTIPGEGKTFVGINLAAIFSMLDKRVIILDFDLRKPRIGKIFDVDTNNGLSNYLIGKSTLDKCIFPSGYPNIDIIPSGPVPPNPSELIAKPETLELLEELKKTYDYIFIDTPPVGLVTDAIDMLKIADYPVYVVRADYSERSFLENVNGLIFDNGIAKLSVVVNDLGRGASMYGQKSGYGYGYGYGYGDGMGYYSDDVVAKKTWLQKLTGIFKK